MRHVVRFFVGAVAAAGIHWVSTLPPPAPPAWFLITMRWVLVAVFLYMLGGFILSKCSE